MHASAYVSNKPILTHEAQTYLQFGCMAFLGTAARRTEGRRPASALAPAVLGRPRWGVVTEGGWEGGAVGAD